MEKREIRRQCLERRRALSAVEVAEKSAAVRERVELLPAFARAGTILCYVSSKDNEVDTRPMIEQWLARGKTVLVPIAERDYWLLWSDLRSLDDLALARFGIFEPREECRRVQAPPVDAPVLVPGIAFSTAGARIGYGGGYYDRFLAAHRGASIALAFDVQIVGAWPIEPHDAAMDFVVTETRVYGCVDALAAREGE